MPKREVVTVESVESAPVYVESVEVVDSVAENTPAGEGCADKVVSTRYEYTSAGDHAPTGHAAKMHAPTGHTTKMHATTTEATTAEMHPTATETAPTMESTAATETTPTMESTAAATATAATATCHGGRCNGDCRPKRGRGEATD
jgi:hypothetical protein